MGCGPARSKPKRRRTMPTDPFALFNAWLAEARASEPNDPEAMALATADKAGSPSVRMVLLKGHGPEGFVFYTNEASDKGGAVGVHPAGGSVFPGEAVPPQSGVGGRVRGVPGGGSRCLFR